MTLREMLGSDVTAFRTRSMTCSIARTALSCFSTVVEW